MRTLVVNALRMSGERTAIGRHIEHLLQQWSKLEIPFGRIIVMSPHKLQLEYLESKTPLEVRCFGRHWPPLLWEQSLLPGAAKGVAAFLSFYTCPLSYQGCVVVSNHGIYEAIPNEFPWWRRIRATPINCRSTHRADRVITNSLATKADLVKYFGVSETKIDVIYPGPSDLFFMRHNKDAIDAEVARVFGKKVPYLIFVGKLAKRRHVPNLIEAFSIVRRKENLPHYLLIVGPNVNNLPVQKLAAQHGVGQYVKYCPYIDHRELAKLYAGADVFVLPSIYEGLSRTMFEAMASGTAVLTVDHPALAEGGGDAVLSVPTPFVEDLVKGLSALLTNESVRIAYEVKGGDRVRKFSLRECAKATMDVLDKAAPSSDEDNQGDKLRRR